MLGFETIGNATLTVFDGNPVLTTDPWLDGKPYFGSWKHAYDIPKQQRENAYLIKCNFYAIRINYFFLFLI